jgi:hypothetical protein
MNKIFLSLVVIPTITVSSTVLACPQTTSDQKALEQSNVAELKTQGENAILYNFQEQKCDALSDARSDVQISAYLPSDEDWQGLYNRYRFKGEKPIAALAHVYNTMLDTNIRFKPTFLSKKDLFARRAVLARKNTTSG